jgi:hypothetical protein
MLLKTRSAGQSRDWIDLQFLNHRQSKYHVWEDSRPRRECRIHSFGHRCGDPRLFRGGCRNRSVLVGPRPPPADYFNLQATTRHGEMPREYLEM